MLTPLLVRPLCGQYKESFEAPEPDWKLADRDCPLRVVRHERTSEQAHSGQSSEFVQLTAGLGTYVHLTRTIPPARIIDELAISMWVKSNRAGVQLSARVVLPRSKDPRTGQPLSTLIRGSAYQQVGTWEKLTIETPARALARQLPLLRSQFGPAVNSREAYIDLLVFNAYGGRGRSDVWIDDLEVSGLVSTGIRRNGSVPPGSERAAEPNVSDPPVAGADGNSVAETNLRGSVFLIDGRPSLVRAIDYNGEPFEWLKSLGFNTIRLAAPATPEQLREAEESGLRLITPPPANQPPEALGSAQNRVLAWDLGEALGADSVEPVRRLAQQLRGASRDRRRAMICLPREALVAYSRIADILWLEPPGPNGSVPFSDLGPWYLSRAKKLRLGVPFWATIPTQTPLRTVQQAKALGADTSVPSSLEPEQIRLLVYHAIASGARGLLFRSYSRLDQSDRMSSIRARTLQWINLELSLVEPWATTGEHEGEIDTGDPAVRVSILKTDRSRLLLVLRQAADQQYVAAPVDQRSVSFEVFGAPETDEVYRIAADGLHRIKQRRGAGVRIALDQAPAVTAVVLTQDRLVINFLARQLQSIRRQRDWIVGEVAAQMYAAVVQTHQRLLAVEPAAVTATPALDRARQELQQFEQLVEGGGHERSYEFLRRGLQELARLRYQEWQTAVRSFSSPVASPLTVNYFCLPDHYALSQRLRGASWGPNALAGGDFESLPHLQSSGWRHLEDHRHGADSAVELSLQSPYSGRSCLRMQSWLATGAPARSALTSPPVSITSGAVPVHQGQIVRIHGWARVPQPLSGSLDGLKIFDSLAGADLALRIRQATDWQEFTLYRAAPRDGTLTLTFSLTGLGEAWLDNVTVSALQANGAATPLPAPTAGRPLPPAATGLRIR